MDSFAAIISEWPSAAALARDLGEKEVTVRAWRARGIPGAYWNRIVAAAQARDLATVTLERLALVAAQSASTTPSKAA